MMNVINKLKQSEKMKKALPIALCVFVALYTFSMPAFSGRLYFNYISYFFIACLSVLTFLHYFLYSKFVFSKILLIMPFFVLWSFLGTALYSHNFRNWFGLVLMLYTFALMFYSLKAITDLKKFLKFVLYGILAFTLYFIFVYRNELVNFKNISYFRLGNYFDNPNAIGSYCSFAILIVLYISLFFDKKKDLFYLFALIPLLLVGFSTGSRNFMLDIFLYSCLLLFFRLKNKPLLLGIIILSLISAFVILMFLPFMSTISERILSAIKNVLGIAQRLDTSLYQRLLWQKYGYFLGSKNLIFGYGIGGFAKYSGIGTYTHSNFAELLTDFGLVGLILFYLLPLYCFIKVLSSLKEEKYLVMTIFISVCLIGGFVDIYFSNKTTYILFAVMAYCAEAVPDKKSLMKYCSTYLIEI